MMITLMLNVRFFWYSNDYIKNELFKHRNKDKRGLQNFFNSEEYFIKISFETVNSLFASYRRYSTDMRKKFISICNILKQLDATDLIKNEFTP